MEPLRRQHINPRRKRVTIDGVEYALARAPKR
jgi:hypothetical protein